MTDAEAKQHWMNHRLVVEVEYVKTDSLFYKIGLRWSSHTAIPDGFHQWLQDYIRERMSNQSTQLKTGELVEVV
jgi:hypothetical protein